MASTSSTRYVLLLPFPSVFTSFSLLTHTTHLTPHTTTQQLYPDQQLTDAELRLLAKTKMTDHYVAQYCEYKVCIPPCPPPTPHPSIPPNTNKSTQGCEEDKVPASITEQKDQVLKQINEYKEKADKFLDVFYPDEDVQAGFAKFNLLTPEPGDESKKSLFNLEYLGQEYGITKDHVEGLYSLAKLRYEVGDYGLAQMFLHYYRSIADLDNDVEARWGKFAADTLMVDWPAALDTMKTIQDSIEKGVPTQYATQGAQLQARAWLMHWSMFIFFFFTDENGVACDDGLDKLVFSWLPDMYSPEKEGSHRYLKVIQTICPHLMRYVCAAIIVGQEKGGKRATGQESGHIKLRQRNKDLIKLIEMEKTYYSDPITTFVRRLLSECDLEGAHECLAQCQMVMEADFFLAKHAERFVRQAREMIFESYCRIHSVMDIGMVAKKLGQSNEDAECYIVKMIRGAQLDAKIDSEANQVLLASQGSTLYVARGEGGRDEKRREEEAIFFLFCFGCYCRLVVHRVDATTHLTPHSYRNIREKTKLVRDKTDQLIERLQDRRV